MRDRYSWHTVVYLPSFWQMDCPDRLCHLDGVDLG
jgi:hypothetical protein